MKSKLHLTTLFNVLLVMAIAASIWLSPSAQAAGETEDYNTVITVNIGRDLNTSMSESCATFISECSLRRAIVQARLLASEDRPALIQFNIPATADEGYDEVLGVWNLQILAPADQYVFRDLTGGIITIDGYTQPGGRATGPKIFLIGPSQNKNAINISGGLGYEIRGLAFQQFGTSLMISGSNSIIEDNWFGLSADGSSPAWRDEDDHSQGSGSAGINMTIAATGNTIQGNYFLGLIGNAAAIRGEANTFQNNFVGTDSTGNVTGKLTDPTLLCTEVDWYGGSGLLADGPEHIIDGNIIAGVRLDVFQSSSQPDAIWVESTCDRCIVQANHIGLDIDGDPVGVCGQGIDITNGEDIQVLDNHFANTFRSAIFLNGALYRDGTITGNLVIKDTPWIQPDDATKPDAPICRYSGLPDGFEWFNPARVTSIDDTTISGTAGNGNPCPNCIIEVFLDDNDGIEEAVQFLGTTTADPSGNWTLTISTPIPAGYGVRTTTTSVQFNQIPGMDAGTTAGLSELYQSGYLLYLPLVRR